MVDAVASVMPMESGEKLVREAVAQDWFRDPFAYLKAIAACKARADSNLNCNTCNC